MLGHPMRFPPLISVISIVLRLITEALQKMKGKIPEIAGSHVSSRVLQVVFSIFFKFQVIMQQ